jgi:succinoglycan biosynthesis transport protein ExoP
VRLGFILALAGGIGSGVAAESLDHSIRTPEQLARLTQLSPLAVIPFMPNEQDLSRAVKRRRLLPGAGVGALVTILALLHMFVVPLDVLWFAALRRFGVE